MSASQIALCTIATRSHLALARAMLESARTAMPEVSLYLLLVDTDESATGPDALLTKVRGVEILSPRQVTDELVLGDLITRYTAAEVCYALKPSLLKHLLRAGYAKVHYVDSDIWLLGALDGPIALLEGNALLLTPHLLHADVSFNRGASEIDILRAGTFNAGYMAVTQLALNLGFLDWWQERVTHWGYNEPRLGMCGDQRWLDPVPYLFDKVVICRDPGINVGYWRAPLAPMERRADRVFIGGQPLTMLHLSGFDPHHPDSFSRYCNGIDTFAGILQELLHQYADRLLANGWEADRQHRYRYSRWWHGTSLAVRMLRAGVLAMRLRRARRVAS